MPRSQTTLRASWRQAFDAVIEQYTDIKSTHGTNRAIDPETLDESRSQRSPKFVKPSRSDFIADVELAANDSLNEVEFFIFRQCFMEFTHNPDNVKEPYMTSIKEKLGRVLGARRIYPVSVYFKGRDVR